jgi:hypothetical protein
MEEFFDKLKTEEEVTDEQVRIAKAAFSEEGKAMF